MQEADITHHGLAVRDVVEQAPAGAGVTPAQAARLAPRPGTSAPIASATSAAQRHEPSAASALQPEAEARATLDRASEWRSR